MMKYAKSIVSAVIAALTSVQVALDHGPISTTQWITLGIGAAISLAGVWAVPNSNTTTVSNDTWSEK